jgi:hypothetical protein
VSGARDGLTRRQVLRAGAAAASLAAWGAPGCGRGDGDARGRGDGRPNVLFVLSDSHRARTTGCYGDAQARTPHFDALAASGLRLSSAVSSTPLCRPYRASLMAGCHSHRTGLVTNNRSEHNTGVYDGAQWEPARRGLTTLGRHFSAAGYRCGYLGKWHLGEVDLDPGPLRFGFDDEWIVSGRTPRGVVEASAHDYWSWTRYAGAPPRHRPHARRAPRRTHGSCCSPGVRRTSRCCRPTSTSTTRTWRFPPTWTHPPRSSTRAPRCRSTTR